MKDGWHKIGGYEIYVENDRVRYGVKRDHNNSLVPAFPYRVCWQRRNGMRYQSGWDNCCGLSVSAFKSGVYRGTIEMF